MSTEPVRPRVDLQVLAEDAEAPSAIVPPEPISADPVSAEAVAEATSGGLGARLRARYQRVQADSIRLFPVPGWGGELVVRAKLPSREDLETWTTGGTGDDAFVVVCTVEVLALDGGELTPIAGGWGPELAQLLGMEANTPPTRLVAAVLNDSPMRVTRFAERMLEWINGENLDLEVALGE